MSRYTNVKIHISEGQKVKIKNAIDKQSGVSIRLTHDDLSGEDVLALTQAQINKMTKAYQNGTGMALKISKTQLAHNMKVEGGFLPALLAMLASTVGPLLLKTILPSLGVGALTGLASTAASKVVDKITGSGLYLKKGGVTCKITPAGEGLYLSPWKKGNLIASGLYMKKGSGYVDGAGLLLGPNSPFKDIPILGLLL